MGKKAKYDNDSKMEVSELKSKLEPAKLHLSVPFATVREAEIAYNSLRVDGEPKRSQVVKTLSVQDNHLIADFSAPDARQLRLSVNTLMDHLLLVQKTISRFNTSS